MQPLENKKMDTLTINGRPRKQYTITQSGVLITTFNNLKLPTEEHIIFENIKNDRLFYKHKSPILLIAAGVSLLFYIIILADSLKHHTNYPTINKFTWPTLTLLLVASYFLFQPKAYLLKTFTGKYIKFAINKNEQEVSEFTAKLIENRNQYIRLKYGQPTLHLSYDSQISNFTIMARENIITAQECQEKIDALNRLFNQTTPPVKTFIGYSKN